MCKLFVVSSKTLKPIREQLKKGIYICPTSKSGKHRAGMSSECTQDTLKFMEYLIEKHAYPSPSSRGGRDGIPIVHLSSQFTKKFIYEEEYLKYDGIDADRKLAYNSFAKLWKEKCPHVKIFNPKYDLCNSCCELKKIPVDNSEIILYNHLQNAYLQRSTFNENVKSTRLDCNINTNVQLTFDYAEKILIPRYVDQQASFYFKTGLKVDLFGVANNTAGIQSNYVLPEGRCPTDKGINSIASMLFHNLNKYHGNIINLYLMADNCSGQNKNCYMMWFLCYLVIRFDKFNKILLKFLIAGHTKNFCDAAFGLCKRSIKRKDVLTPKHVVEAYRASSKCNIVETVDNVTFYNWKEFLGQFFVNKVPEMTLQHEFKIEKNELGKVFTKH